MHVFLRILVLQIGLTHHYPAVIEFPISTKTSGENHPYFVWSFLLVPGLSFEDVEQFE